LIANGGGGGSEGNPGNPGIGGIGGSAGNPCFPYVEIDGRGGIRTGERCYSEQAAKGAAGPDGDKASSPKGAGASQPALTPVLSIGKSDGLFEYSSINAILMSLRRCDLDVLNELDLNETVNRAEWIALSASSPYCGKSFYADRRVRLSSQEVGEPTTTELQAVAAQAYSIVSNLKLGLDTFGNAPHYVSDLTPQFLKEQNAEWIKIAQTIQDAYLLLITEGSDRDVKSSQLGLARQQVANAYEIAKKTIINGQQSITTIQVDILKLNSRVLELQQQMQEADAALKRAVRARSGGCDLGNLIAFVAGVVTIATAVYTGYGALSGMMAAANAVPRTQSGVQGVINDFKVITKSFEDSKLTDRYVEMQRAFDQVKDALKTDKTKIVISSEAFEEQLAPYLDMPEAVRFRDLMRQLADVAQSKNSKQYEITQLVEQIQKEQAEQTSRRLESDRIGRMVANLKNPAMAECTVFLGRFLEQTKLQILRTTDLQRRGVSYLTCTPIKLSYRSTVVEDLLIPQAQLGEAWTRALQEQGGARQSMDAEFELKRESDPAFFSNLAEKGQAVFSVPIDHPSFNRGGTSFVLASEVGLNIDFPNGVKAYTCRLTHSGTSLVRDKAGKVFNFLHSRRPTILSYRRSGEDWVPTVAVAGNLRGDDKYISLSPFTTWTVEFDPVELVDWSTVTKFACAFKLTVIPSSQVYHPEAALQAIKM